MFAAGMSTQRRHQCGTAQWIDVEARALVVIGQKAADTGNVKMAVLLFQKKCTRPQRRRAESVPVGESLKEPTKSSLLPS